MFTLHKATETTKSILKWGGLLCGIFFFMYLLYQGTLFVKNTYFPTPVPPPLMAFGQLPPLSFPEGLINQNYTYEIETVSGFLPFFPDRALVFKTVSLVPGLLDLDNARERIQHIPSFDNGSFTEQVLNDTLYQWRSTKKEASIIMDIVSTNFTYTTPIDPASALLSRYGYTDGDMIKKEAERFLADMGSYPSDVDPEKTKLTFLRLDNSTLIPVLRPIDALFVRVDFVQKDLNKTPVFYPNPSGSTMSVLLGIRDSGLSVITASMFHQIIGEESTTYPLQTSQEAYEALVAGKGSIRSYTGDQTTIKIRDVFLAYYLPEEKQNYIMPVAVFVGDDNFVAYVPITQSTLPTKPAQ